MERMDRARRIGGRVAAGCSSGSGGHAGRCGSRPITLVLTVTAVALAAVVLMRPASPSGEQATWAVGVAGRVLLAAADLRGAVADRFGVLVVVLAAWYSRERWVAFWRLHAHTRSCTSRPSCHRGSPRGVPRPRSRCGRPADRLATTLGRESGGRSADVLTWSPWRWSTVSTTSPLCPAAGDRRRTARDRVPDRTTPSGPCADDHGRVAPARNGVRRRRARGTCPSDHRTSRENLNGRPPARRVAPREVGLWPDQRRPRARRSIRRRRTGGGPLSPRNSSAACAPSCATSRTSGRCRKNARIGSS